MASRWNQAWFVRQVRVQRNVQSGFERVQGGELLTNVGGPHGVKESATGLGEGEAVARREVLGDLLLSVDAKVAEAERKRHVGRAVLRVAGGRGECAFAM